MPADARGRGAAVLGSRSFRRQVNAVVAAATSAHAYSVGFGVARGTLTGFTVYLHGDFAGARAGALTSAAASSAVLHPSRLALQ